MCRWHRRVSGSKTRVGACARGSGGPRGATPRAALLLERVLTLCDAEEKTNGVCRRYCPGLHLQSQCAFTAP